MTNRKKAFKLGVERLLENASLRKALKGKRVALLGHPASICKTRKGYRHSLDALMECKDLKITAAFGPQHGMRGDKQDNMIESPDYPDPVHGIPVFSLYGEVRRPTGKMLATFDVLLVDLQDVGTRIYTYLTTVGYLVEDCAKAGKGLWILDRPNPAGRPVEGSTLLEGYESFVGIGPLPMRHGLTLGEAALWYKAIRGLKTDLKVVEMEGYAPETAPGYGWPEDRPWINPSPNASSLNMARCFPGTVMLEGTTLSEGRGTTVPLEIIGAPDVDPARLLERMRSLAPAWMKGSFIRPLTFEPTFHKHVGKLCHGFQMHTDLPEYAHKSFMPYRLLALAFKALRQLEPSYKIWRDHAYEYTSGHLPIDVINGGPGLREWVDDPKAPVASWDKRLRADEAAWGKARRRFLLY